MGNYEQLKSAIQAVIKENGKGEITGQILQNALVSMVNALGSGATFIGLATPTTQPIETDSKVFYLALQRGNYTHFGLLVDYDFAIISNISGDWQVQGYRDNLISGEINGSLYQGGCVADDLNAVALGLDTQAHAECSMAIGEGTIAEYYNCFAHGLYNKPEDEQIEACGCGTGNFDRKNAYEVYEDGSIYIIGVGGYDGTNAGQAGVKSLQELINA